MKENKFKGGNLKDRYPNAYRALKAELKKRMRVASLYAWRKFSIDPQRLDKEGEGLAIFFKKMGVSENDQSPFQALFKKYGDP